MLPALALSNLSVNVLGSGGVLARGVRAQQHLTDVDAGVRHHGRVEQVEIACQGDHQNMKNSINALVANLRTFAGNVGVAAGQVAMLPRRSRIWAV